MSLKLTTSLSQRLVLTPQLRQRIEMLQMTTLELTDLIQQQILENPVLEEVATQEEVGELAEKILDHLASADPGAAPDQPQRLEAAEPELGSPSSNGSGDLEGMSTYAEGDGEGDGGPGEGHEIAAADLSEDSVGDEIVGEEGSRDAFEEIDFGREFQDYLDPGYKTQEIEYKEDGPTFEQFLTRAPSLADHLEWQLHMSPIEEVICDAAINVIGNLDADGRLNATNEEIAAMGACSEETVEKARLAVMHLDPIGCGARDVRECLLVQLEVKGESDRLAARLISCLLYTSPSPRDS